MIKSEVNKGEVTIMEVEGTGLTIMSELCCLVKAVCIGYCADEEHSEEMTSTMVLHIAEALKVMEAVKRGDDLEDDENADF